jgi:hypothetical protein
MWSFGVPNVPCGVESIFTVYKVGIEDKQKVPNVPCGVESKFQKLVKQFFP